MRKAFSSFCFFIVITICIHAQNKIPKEFCISEDEFRLYELINAVRSEHGLPLIKLSKSLSFVASKHVLDLNLNHPDTSICNLHSWSDKGNWTACCYQPYVYDQKCMWNKPDELTDYRANGYELAYWDESVIIPDSLIGVWENIPEAMNIILGKGQWSDKKWYALGVGIMNNYVSVWFGARTDQEPIPQICGTNKLRLKTSLKSNLKNLIIRKKTDRFFLIYGSYNRIYEAEIKAKAYIIEGFKDAKVVISGNKIRIALSHHLNLDEAKKAKSNLPDKYQEAWIIKY